MKNPSFVHGSTAAIQKLIDNKKIKYPSYIWNTTKHTYQFLNKQENLEEIGIPQLIGTLDSQIILGELDDGLYRVQGQHKITENDETVYLSASDILVIVSTVDDVKRIRRITVDEILDYNIYDGEIVSRDRLVTDTYLKEQGYITSAVLDAKLLALENSLKSELQQYIDENVSDLVDTVIDQNITHYPEEDIRGIF